MDPNVQIDEDTTQGTVIDVYNRNRAALAPGKLPAVSGGLLVTAALIGLGIWTATVVTQAWAASKVVPKHGLALGGLAVAGVGFGGAIVATASGMAITAVARSA